MYKSSAVSPAFDMSQEEEDSGVNYVPHFSHTEEKVRKIQIYI